MISNTSDDKSARADSNIPPIEQYADHYSRSTRMSCANHLPQESHRPPKFWHDGCSTAIFPRTSTCRRSAPLWDRTHLQFQADLHHFLDHIRDQDPSLHENEHKDLVEDPVFLCIRLQQRRGSLRRLSGHELLPVLDVARFPSSSDLYPDPKFVIS